jgi:hypothetical protein
MRHFKACSWVVALALVACGGDDGAPAGETEGTGTDTGTTAPTTSPTTTTMTTDPSTTDPSTTDPSTTNDTTDKTDTGTTGDTEDTEGVDDTGTGTTGGEDGAYPACEPQSDPICPDEFPECINYPQNQGTLCSVTCTDVRDCPDAPGGNATVICNQLGTCSLDCSGGADCPDGMSCISFMAQGQTFERCAWPNE